MKKQAKLLRDDQHDRFVEAARAAGCDDDEGSFDKVLGVVARAAPKKSVQKRKLAKAQKK